MSKTAQKLFSVFWKPEQIGSWCLCVINQSINHLLWCRPSDVQGRL